MSQYAERLKSNDLVMLFSETLPMQMDLLREGLSHGQVGQRPFEMGYRATFVLNDLGAGKTVEDPIAIGLDVRTQETAATCRKQHSVSTASGETRSPASQHARPALDLGAGRAPRGQ